MIRRLTAALAGLAGMVLAALPGMALAQTPGRQTPASASTTTQVTGAVLQGLDKLVGRVHTIDAPLNQEVRFGTLSIVVRACVPSAPEAPPESAVFLEITENKPGEAPDKVFSGWMFASSPALSALEHPIYDVTVISCMTTASAGSSKSP